jgi:peptide/nickel transport system permease protein
MGRYIIRRLLQAIPLLFIISVILFVLSVKMGDPLATFGGRTVLKSEDRKRLTRQLGLDQPLYVQYAVWLVGNDWVAMDLNGDGKPDVDENGQLIYGTRKGILRGDLGTSFTTKQPVTEMIAERLPNTLLLMLTSEVVILIFSLVIGLISALKQYSIFDHTVTALSFIGYSMPIPLLAIGLIYVFAVYFKRWGLPYFPTGGMFDPQVGPGWQQTIWHMVLPVTAISLISIAGYSRYVRANMLEVIGQDYIRTARAKGLAERRVVFIHALKNAALPLVTVVGLDLPFLLAGAVVTETIFAWPGMGRLFYDHTTRSDFPVLMGIIMIISVAVVIFQILTDLTYTYLDPRIRYD